MHTILDYRANHAATIASLRASDIEAAFSREENDAAMTLYRKQKRAIKRDADLAANAAMRARVKAAGL